MIYFIRSYNKFIKIGTSTDPGRRLKELQTASPINFKIKAVLEGSYKTEKGLHEIFSHIHHSGEWFRYTDELKWFMRAIQENPEINNIKTLYMISQKMRIKAKAKRQGKKSKLSKRISEA